MIPYKYVIGVDPSLTGTGVCVLELSETEFKVSGLKTIKTSPGSHMYARIKRYKGIGDQVLGFLPTGRSCVAIEGYGFMAIGRAVSVMPELGGVLRFMLEALGIPWVEFAPTSVKKYGSGSGAAKKDLMMMEVFKRYGKLLHGTDLKFEDSNQTDAFVLAAMLADKILWRQHDIKPSKEHQEVLGKMEPERFEQLGFS